MSARSRDIPARITPEALGRRTVSVLHLHQLRRRQSHDGAADQAAVNAAVCAMFDKPGSRYGDRFPLTTSRSTSAK